MSGGSSAIVAFALHDCFKSIRLSSRGIDLPSPAIPQRCRHVRTIKNKGGTRDKCCASISICRRVVLSLVRCDRVGLFCRQVAIRLLREVLNDLAEAVIGSACGMRVITACDQCRHVRDGGRRMIPWAQLRDVLGVRLNGPAPDGCVARAPLCKTLCVCRRQ